jgi:hypothetical protein
VVSLAIGITTSPRPTPTLARSLASLRAAGWDGPVTISANHDINGELADAAAALGPLTLLHQPWPLSIVQHWSWLLQWLVTDTGAAVLVLGQDDVGWTDAARGFFVDLLDAPRDPQVGCLSLHAFGSTMAAMEAAGTIFTAPGWYPIPPGVVMRGAQVLALPRGAAERLLTDRAFALLREHPPHDGRKLDEALHAALVRLGFTDYLFHPRLVHHDWGHIHTNRAARVPARLTSHRDVVTRLAAARGWRRGAELGLGHGHLARRLLQSCPRLTHIGVDVLRNPERAQAVQQLAAQFPARFVLHPCTTATAADAIPDQSLDYVFIDASHHYLNVAEDIRLWRPKRRPGGWFGGHDYSPRFPGVIRAVTEAFGAAVTILPFDVWQADQP